MPSFKSGNMQAGMQSTQDVPSSAKNAVASLVAQADADARADELLKNKRDASAAKLAVSRATVMRNSVPEGKVRFLSSLRANSYISKKGGMYRFVAGVLDLDEKDDAAIIAELRESLKGSRLFTEVKK